MTKQFSRLYSIELIETSGTEVVRFQPEEDFFAFLHKK